MPVAAVSGSIAQCSRQRDQRGDRHRSKRKQRRQQPENRASSISSAEQHGTATRRKSARGLVSAQRAGQRRPLVTVQELGSGQQHDAQYGSQAAPGARPEQCLLDRVAHQKNAGEHQRRRAEPNAPVGCNEGLEIPRWRLGVPGRDDRRNPRRRLADGRIGRPGSRLGLWLPRGLRCQRRAQAPQIGVRRAGAEKADNAQQPANDPGKIQEIAHHSKGTCDGARSSKPSD
jgi:hypothetical protein